MSSKLVLSISWKYEQTLYPWNKRMVLLKHLENEKEQLEIKIWNQEMKNAVGEWENISGHLKTIRLTQLRRTQDGTKHRADFSNESVKELIRESFFPPTVPCDIVLLTQERAQVDQGYMDNVKPELQGESCTSLTIRRPQWSAGWLPFSSIHRP